MTKDKLLEHIREVEERNNTILAPSFRDALSTMLMALLIDIEQEARKDASASEL